MRVTLLIFLIGLTVTPIKLSFAQEVNMDFNPYVFSPGESFYDSNYYVGTNGLRVRSTPEDDGKVMGHLNLNDRVRVVNPELINGKYVEIQIIKSSAVLLPSDNYYVAFEFLTQREIDYKEFKGKYFVVVNVASEMLRVYERQCADNSCPHKMVMETEVVVGEDKDLKGEEKGKGRSILGSYRVTGWAKFYQDVEGHYPAWYKEGYPMPPARGDNDWKDWFKDKYMPVVNGERHGDMRGAFGWYTAFVSPNPYGQWTHGTLGWGEDKDEYIKKTKKFMINVVSNPRSSGCTRNNNEAIAFLRQIAETGTPIVKIYAREGLLDAGLSRYPEATRQWKYIFTKNAGQRAERAEVIKALGVTEAEVDAYWRAHSFGGVELIDPQSTLNQILEVGTYTLKARPTAYGFKERKKILGKWRATGITGNVYGLKNEQMAPGVFYVDAGVLKGYRHPMVKMEVSGFMDEETPPWMDFYDLKQ